MTRKVKTSPLKLSIGKIWNSGEGTTHKLDLDTPVDFNDTELTPASNLRAEVMLIKLKHEISAIIESAEMTVELKCHKCLKKFKKNIIIENAEREFLADKKRKSTDPNELFYIDFSDMTIDLTDMFRQEIFLHFPLISVCSKSCKGICPVCGINRNEKKCKCKIPTDAGNKPFKDLKKLMSN